MMDTENKIVEGQPEVVVKILWTDTFKMIQPGETRRFSVTAETGNSVRVAASRLNDRGAGKFSVTFEGNDAIVTNNAE
jgi:hypothetical protein